MADRAAIGGRRLLVAAVSRPGGLQTPPSALSMAGTKGREDHWSKVRGLLQQREVRHLLVALWLMVAALSGPLPAAAQMQVPSVLEDVKLVTEDDQKAAFMLRFSPREPQFSAINQNPAALSC